jgi:myo-inositol 2-dehydrogenase/D-chiro-inositol 1-dehydrogenase
VEFQEWINEVVTGTPLTGPSAWDGYAAQVVCDAGVESLYSGERVEIELGSRPALYL